MTHYYQTFDTNRAALNQLYTEHSMLSYEGEQFLGVNDILGKLSQMPSITHSVQTFDAQPTTNNGILAFVSGGL